MSPQQRLLPDNFPIEFEKRLIEFLSTLGEFETQSSLLVSVFSYGKLRGIRTQLPSANTPKGRVEETLKFLAPKHLIRDMLVMLEQGYPSVMAEHNVLSQLATEVCEYENHR